VKDLEHGPKFAVPDAAVAVYCTVCVDEPLCEFLGEGGPYTWQCPDCYTRWDQDGRRGQAWTPGVGYV